MKGIQDIFTGYNPVKSFTRGIGMNAINHINWLKKTIVEYGMK